MATPNWATLLKIAQQNHPLKQLQLRCCQRKFKGFLLRSMSVSVKSCACASVLVLTRTTRAVLSKACGAASTSARGWVSGLAAYETLLLSELGYGGGVPPAPAPDWAGQMAQLAILEKRLAHYLLAGPKSDVMGARKLLTERLQRMA